MDQQKVTLLVLLGLSAAFDTMDHEILTATLESEFGVTGNALKWIKSFLSHRKQRVKIKQEFSTNSTLSCGVPQGSCLGPVLFLLYVSQLFQIINKHLVPAPYGYADDTQLYLSFSPDSSVVQDQAIQTISNCIDEVRTWSVTAILSCLEFLNIKRVLNGATRIMCFTPRSTHITPVLRYLHWLPIKFRVEFKIALLVYKALNGMAPDYIADLLLENRIVLTN